MASAAAVCLFGSFVDMSFTKEEITEVFHAFDADKSGQVSSQELVNLFAKLFNGDNAKAKEAADVSSHVTAPISMM